MVLSNGGLLSSVENIAQAPRCGSIFSFCSENKKFGYRGNCSPFLGGFHPLPSRRDKSSFPRSKFLGCEWKPQSYARLSFLRFYFAAAFQGVLDLSLLL
jgi:hypothetical protein